MELKYDGGYYLTDGIRRTCLYITPHACEVAIERGQFYTEAEYRRVIAAPKRRGNGIRRLNAVIKIEK